MKIFNKFILWVYFKIHSIFFNISVSLYNTEVDILKADPNITNENGKIIQRKRHRNKILENFYAGNRDEKYMQDYYEILKKSDKFIKTATPHQMAVVADKHGSNFGLKDEYGRRYEHYGFFDGKHKHVGKTLGDVLSIEIEDRRTKDDDYSIMYIFNNKPIVGGLVNIMDVVEKTDKGDYEYEVLDVFRKSKQYEFPIKVYREDENIVNKIEQLTEFLHVKKIAFEYRQLEFFIPIKFKTEDIEINSKIYDELTNIKSIFVRNNYGELIGFSVNKLIKRIRHNDTHEVWKFEGIEIKTIIT